MPRATGRWRAPSLRLEVHGDAVDAVAQVRRRRAVLEHVTEVAAAAAAVHLGADHAVAAVGRGLDRARNRIVEARPAGAALELLLRCEQLLPAAHAGERAGALLVIERAAAGTLGAVAAQDIVLLGGEELAPLLVGVGDRETFLFHSPTPCLGAGRRPQAALRSSSSIETPCGARRKATRTPGRTVVGSRLNSAPLALSSATTASMPLTSSPKWSSP